MGGTYQRTLILVLAVIGLIPMTLVAVVAVVLIQLPDLNSRDAATVLLALAGGLGVATLAAAAGSARAVGWSIETLREGTAMMVGPNPRHRLRPEESDLAELARNVNELAERAGRAGSELEDRLAQATRELAFEKETLASVLFAMGDGVVVCNAGLQIVLSNAAARRMLSRPARPLRRGQTIFSSLDPALLRPLVEPLRAPRDETAGPRLERGTLTLPSGTVAQVSATVATGVVAGAEPDCHYVFVLRDVTQQVAVDRTRDRFMLETVRRLRNPAAAILSAAEILREYDELPKLQRRSFVDVLWEDAARLADELDAMQAAAGTPTAGWAGDEVRIRELAERAAADAKLPLAARSLDVRLAGEDVTAGGDRLALLRVVRRLVELAAEHAAAGSWLEIRWRRIRPNLVELAIERPAPHGERGPGLSGEEAVFETRLEHGGPTIRDVVTEHRGELWVRRTDGRVGLVLLLPAIAEAAPGERAAVAADGLPTPQERAAEGHDAVARQVLAVLGDGGFYDLRPPPDARPAHAEARLAELSFVVFDLETTGLGPGRGDEVVSIGAVRVRGGRVIPEDYFFSLVDPGRPIPPGSTRIHGITDEMVAGQPRIEDVLPRFIEFVAESVPAAHFGAFDLAFLNPRLVALGRPTIPPDSVLDTMLLSASLFPSWGGYEVEEIAARLGVEVTGRHTSLGDALTTAQVLVHLLAVLEQRGTPTLGAALKLQAGDVLRKVVGAVRAELNWS